jgi:hypothetical protein
MRRLLFVIPIAAIAALIIVPSFAGAAGTSTWKAYNYNSSGHAITPTSATSTGADNASFNFQPNVYTAQLVTTAKTLVGDRTGGTVNATLTVTGVTGTFVDQNGGGCTPDTQTVRLFFTTKNPGFNFTDYWWSNPIAMTLNGNNTMTLTVPLTDPSQWSDWNGQLGNSTVPVTAAFNAAVAKVDTIGLSFGGGCFFENGVTTNDGSGTFALTAFSD